MLLVDEIAEEYPVSGKSVKTPSGWKAVKTVYKTVPLDVWELHTSNRVLRGSGHHLVRSGMECHRMQDLKPGELIDTEGGPEGIVRVGPTGEKEAMYDLTVDSEDGLFYSNGIVSHNSTTFAARQRILADLLPMYKSLYVVPFVDHKKTFARRYQEMEIAFNGISGKQNLYNKLYENGSTVEFIHCRTTGAPTRGKTTIELLFDEIQQLEPELVSEITYTQTTAKYPTIVYAGTALSTDTLLEDRWRQSSEGIWMIKSPNGKDWIDTSDKELLMKICSNPYGPICPYTGKPLRVENGHYVHKNMSAYRAGRVGLHVPQVIIPDLVYSPTQWTRIYNSVMTDSETKTCQECFGLAVEGGFREISTADLQRMCILQETKEELKNKARSGQYRAVISGCDWGGSDYNPVTKTKTSYTVHCIIGITLYGKVDILHYREYAGMEYEDIAASIAATHIMYGANVMASDYGVGAYYNTYLRNHLPMGSHFVIKYSGPGTAPLAVVRDSGMQNLLSVNRTEAISRIFTEIKHPEIRIRCQGWNVMSKYLLQYLALYRQVDDTAAGLKTFRYIRAATKPDDALHALLFAYIIGTYYIGQPIIRDENLERQLRALAFTSSPNQNFGAPGGFVTSIPYG